MLEAKGFGDPGLRDMAGQRVGPALEGGSRSAQCRPFSANSTA